jgi:lysophospholipase L1-like esterase
MSFIYRNNQIRKLLLPLILFSLRGLTWAQGDPLSDFNAHYEAPEGLDFISADNPGFAYSGRIDFSNPLSPVLIWQGTEIRARFTGTRISVRLSKVQGNCYFNLIVDGKVHVLKPEASPIEFDYELKEDLPPGTHELSLFKRTEAAYGQANFEGIMVSAGESLAGVPDGRPLKIEFYGDSITVGACDEEPSPKDSYADLITHNNYVSYGANAARALNAEYSNISYSGIGLCASWNEYLLPQVWDRLYPRSDSARYDFADRAPDIVVLNVGQNDFGYPAAKGQAFPQGFAEAYVKLVRAMRAQYPQAWIISVEGGMSAYHDSIELQRAWAKALKQLKADDPRVLSLVFKAFTYNHPRANTHAALAKELEAFIRANVPMAAAQ